MRADRSFGSAGNAVTPKRAMLASADTPGAASDGASATGCHSLPLPMAERVLHYEIQAKLGEGGMGIVYKALDQKLHRLVALKFLPPQIRRSSVDLQRFLQEANALSALNHPHIATIYAVETEGEHQFLVLEYLPGGTLKAKLQEACCAGRTLSIDEIFKYARQAAEGLAHAHARGIVHRDVKTSNLMLTEEGDVKITDFGVAKLSGSSIATVAGTLVGTIAYMSPEQALGMDVDSRSDVFSFGVSLFELITGRLPFEAPNDAALITRVASARAPDLKTIRQDVPASLQQVVQTALKKRVEERYQKMDDVLADLEAPADRKAPLTQTRLRTGIQSLVGSSRKQRRWAAAVSMLSLAALVGGVLFFMLPQRTVKQLAVLRLRNIPGDPATEALCDGLTELLTNKLSQLEELHGSLSVVAPSEVLREGKERKQEITSAQVARTALGAALVLEGSLQRIDGRVIVSARLVDTAKQTILVSGEVAAPSENLSELQESLLRKVPEMLKVQVKPEAHRALAAGLPTNPDAYEFYIQGRGFLQRYDLVENLNNAIDVFQQALSRDSTYALAYAGIAEAYLRKYYATKAPALISQARKSAQQAIQLNDSLAPVHYAMGLIHAAGGEYEFAIQRFKNAIKIRPEPDAYRELANAYDSSNQTAEAEATYQTAIHMRPTYWAGYRDLAVFYQTHGRLNEALPLFERVIRLTPDNYAGLHNLGGLYLRLGMHSKATEYFERALSIRPTYATYYNLGTALYHQDQHEDAIAMYERATQLAPTDARPWAALGDVYLLMPQPQFAEEMRRAYAHAIELIEKELLVNPKDGQNWSRIASWRAATDKDKALKEISEALRLSPQDNFVLSRAAYVYELSGMRDQALAAVKSAIEFGFPRYQIERSPTLVRLVQDARYRAFIENKPSESLPVPISNQ